MMVQKLTSWVVIGSIVLLGSPMPASATYEGYSATLTDVIEDFESYDPDEREEDATSLAERTVADNATLYNTIATQPTTTTVTLAAAPAPAPAPTPTPTPMPTPIPPPPPPPTPIPMPTPPPGPPNTDGTVTIIVPGLTIVIQYNGDTMTMTTTEVYTDGIYTVTEEMYESYQWDYENQDYELLTRWGWKEARYEVNTGTVDDPDNDFHKEIDSWFYWISATVVDGVVIAEWEEWMFQSYYIKKKTGTGTGTIDYRYEDWSIFPWDIFADPITDGPHFGPDDQGKVGVKYKDVYSETPGDPYKYEMWSYSVGGSDSYTLHEYTESIAAGINTKTSTDYTKIYNGVNGRISSDIGGSNETKVEASTDLKEDVTIKDWHKGYDQNGVQSGGHRKETIQVWGHPNGVEIIYSESLAYFKLNAGGGETLEFFRGATWAGPGLASLSYSARVSNQNGELVYDPVNGFFASVFEIVFWYSPETFDWNNGTWDMWAVGTPGLPPPVHINVTSYTNLQREFETARNIENQLFGSGRDFNRVREIPCVIQIP